MHLQEYVSPLQVRSTFCAFICVKSAWWHFHIEQNLTLASDMMRHFVLKGRPVVGY